jgi:hypothetical protein
MSGRRLIATEAGRTAETEDEACLTFDEAFAAHHRLVYRYAFCLTRDGALAEEVTQEVFIRFHRQSDAAQRKGICSRGCFVSASVARNLSMTNSYFLDAAIGGW